MHSACMAAVLASGPERILTSEGTYICDVDDLYDAISQVKVYNAKIKRGRLRWFIKEVMKNREEIVIME